MKRNDGADQVGVDGVAERLDQRLEVARFQYRNVHAHPRGVRRACHHLCAPLAHALGRVVVSTGGERRRGVLQTFVPFVRDGFQLLLAVELLAKQAQHSQRLRLLGAVVVVGAPGGLGPCRLSGTDAAHGEVRVGAALHQARFPLFTRQARWPLLGHRQYRLRHISLAACGNKGELLWSGRVGSARRRTHACLSPCRSTHACLSPRRRTHARLAHRGWKHVQVD
mmetsp:Transcript_19948/g.50656  ORF Transcript_19948/g.50656 Transcript_19948/m.50656 type:complete len:224 (+) Transcript_19948:1013-1684(+)